MREDGIVSTRLTDPFLHLTHVIFFLNDSVRLQVSRSRWSSPNRRSCRHIDTYYITTEKKWSLWCILSAFRWNKTLLIYPHVVGYLSSTWSCRIRRLNWYKFASRIGKFFFFLIYLMSLETVSVKIIMKFKYTRKIVMIMRIVKDSLSFFLWLFKFLFLSSVLGQNQTRLSLIWFWWNLWFHENFVLHIWIISVYA